MAVDKSRASTTRFPLSSWRAVGAIFALCLGLVIPAPAPAAGLSGASQDALVEQPKDAGDFLADLGERAVEELNDEAADAQEREQRFRALFNDSFDIPAIGKFVLGLHWRKASESQREDFLSVFEDAIVQRFLPMFEDYNGETFVINELRRDANNPEHVFVNSTITQNDGQSYEVEWRVREDQAGYQILDIVAEGVSMAITLRQEYSSVAQSMGIDGLVDALRKKLAAGAFAPK